MLIFSITTTTKIASVSLHDGRKMLGEIRIEVAKTHSVGILDQIDRMDREKTGRYRHCPRFDRTRLIYRSKNSDFRCERVVLREKYKYL